MAVEDTPEVPIKGPLEEQEHLVLPDVPTRATVASNVAATDDEIASAQVSTKKKGLTVCPSPAFVLHKHTHTHTQRHKHRLY